jgi:uncharacterized protein (DUF1697 family)
MTVYVALLHSIALGGGRRLVMDELRQMAARSGFANPRTLIATGNLVCEADHQPLSRIEGSLEAAFVTSFGKKVDIIVRDADRWLQLAAGNPFEGGKGSQVIVRIMRDPLDGSVVDALERYRSGGERVAVVGGDLFIDFGRQPARSRLLPALTTKRLGTGTLRNWNTVRGLAAMLAP